MSVDDYSTKWRRNIAENFNRLSMVHERYRQTVGRRHIINQCAHYHSPQYDQNVRNIEHCCHSRLAVLA